MSRVVLGSRWRDAPLIVRALMLPTPPHIEVCDVCGATWESHEGHACRWCARRLEADAAFILKPPAPRGYGYATDADLAHLGYDRQADRANDLERWRHDLELAVETGLITEQQGNDAWRSATKNNPASNSSTGTTSTTAPTSTTTQSSTGSPTAAAGPPSHHPRKRGNRRSSSPLPWKPEDAA